MAVIGAGASGLMAALFAAWQGAAVTLFERNNSLGRKLLITGSGRCNLTNAAVAPAAYACAAGTSQARTWLVCSNPHNKAARRRASRSGPHSRRTSR